MSLLAVLITILIGGARLSSQGQATPAPNYSVIAFGAKGDGKTDDTAAFQKAMDARAATGGGVVQASGRAPSRPR